MSEQIGWRAFTQGMRQEAPNWARTLPQMPRLIHQALNRERSADLAPVLGELAAVQRRQNRLLGAIVIPLAA